MKNLKVEKSKNQSLNKNENVITAERLKSKRGITLIALVITVIVMLILAGVAISALTGADGLIEQALGAGQKYNESAKNEANELNTLYGKYFSDGITGGGTTESELIGNVTMNIESKGPYIKVNVVTEPSNNDVRGYAVFCNGYVVKVSDSPEIYVDDLEFNTEYKINCMAIDKVGKIKLSAEEKVKTLEGMYLYNRGDVCATVTGGWKNYMNSAALAELRSDCMYGTITSPNYNDWTFYTKNLIDLTSYRTVNAVATTGTQTPFNLKYTLHMNINTTGGFELSGIKFPLNGKNTRISEDISSYNGSYYIGFSANITDTYIYKVWLEK